MPKLIPLKPREVVRKLQQLGYQGPLPGGRHMHMIKGSRVIPVPFHGGKEIGVGLQSMIIREVGVSREEWLGL